MVNVRMELNHLDNFLINYCPPFLGYEVKVPSKDGAVFAIFRTSQSDKCSLNLGSCLFV